MAKKRLPKKLFIAWNYDGDKPWLDSTNNANLLANKDETVEVGLYELKKTVKLVNKTTVE